MSYTIVYDRLFLRADDRYIPICLYGSSNCTEFINGREVLERSWASFSYCDSMLLADADTLMREVRRWHGGKEKENFKFRGSWMDDAAVIRFFENGIKNAVTIEELKKQQNEITSLHANLCCWLKNDNWSVPIMNEYLRSTEEIINWIEHAKEVRENLLASGLWSSVYINLGFDTRAKIRAIPTAHIDKPVVAKGKHGYVCYLSPNRNSWTCCADRSKAIVFANSEEAYNSLPDAPFALIAADKNTLTTVCKDWILTVNRDGERVCIHKLAARRCQLTKCASYAGKRFTSAKEAIRWYEEKIKPRYPGLTDPVPQQLEVT